MRGRDELKNLYFRFLGLVGSHHRMLARIRREQLVLILNLHQVSAETNPFWPPLTPDIFDELLGFLRRNFRIGLFRDFALGGDDRPSVVLSFDDGYYNFVEYAMPILEKHNVAANMNIIPSCVLSGEPPWNVRLYDFLNSVPRKLINEIQLPGFAFQLADDSERGKLRYGLQISRFLKNRPRSERTELWAEINRVIAKASNLKSTRMMNEAEVREAAKTHEMGVHSYSHESMEFESQEFFENDFQKCVKYFSDHLRLPLYIYAFPNGSYRPEQTAFLERQGIQNILLVGEKHARSGQGVLPRLTVYGVTPAEVTIRAVGYNARKG